MRDLSELSEEEAGFVRRLLIMYPGEGSATTSIVTLPYAPLLGELIAEGYVERKEIDDGINPQTGEPARPQISYRLTDEHADEIRLAAERRSAAAKDN